MDKLTLKDVKARLLEINELVTSLDRTIRAAAFEILAPYYFDKDPTRISSDQQDLKKKDSKAKPATDTPSREAFFSSFNHDKPADNVHLIVAWLYSSYGLYAVSTKELRAHAEEIGLTIPDRPDATMYAAQKDGKSLYRKRDDGYQLTVHGEAYVKQTFNIKKGTLPRLDLEESK
jgi:hypothetical protein